MSERRLPTLDDRLTIGPEVIVREIDGELVLLDLDRAEYFGLNVTGTRIWHWLRDAPTLRDVAVHLAEEFEVAPDQAEADVLTLARDLVERGLVSVLGGPDDG